ncbi:phosphatidylglycerol:prolipoprotein diacylglycerol transferase [Aliiroseovarius halocynthiae]|uniref:Phosphatidylglycerol--prolipoprotein diacylglyceryl transferase n=1 Tax=Aliiroseovarius halocynthiae TaxID=985055 RepID=A0A545SM46_9RHOB|nr:prolipoprotein diacylglyceryl transferase [Aliiroseovarius halocynthiae]TQV66044.1 prolipoprotein diacylglyceryl transferase [Aliiroseovarius halocynthiae]SMR83248.1 phosphatidylglycerol:prolipoprotein diacylglycerol transferase [Aliiroseovarius halocynthiae]
MFMAIPFPDIAPEIFSIELGSITFALRWYAMGYLVGIAIGWWIIARALSFPELWRNAPPMTRAQLEDFATWVILGIIIGGRLGSVIFYRPDYFFANPWDIPKIWLGGMSFHGGFLGVILVTWLYCRRHKLLTASVADLLAIAAPIGIGLVRVANFINAELWGRPTDAPWGVIFPGEYAQHCPGWDAAIGACARHPSQLYEALLEGAVLAIVLLYLAFRRGWLKTPGRLTGLFFLGYGLSRFVVEFFRQADAQFITPDNPWGHVVRVGDLGITMGQTLTLPMIAIGIVTLIWARRRTHE